MNAHRLRQKREIHALAFYEIIFMRIRCHFLVSTPVNHRDLVRAQSFGNGRTINSRVARSDHRDISSDHQLARSELALLDVFESIDNVVFTRNAQGRRLAETHAEKDRAKLFLQFSEANISSNFLAA